MNKHPKTISSFSLAMLNVAAVMSLSGLPIIAKTGYTMVFYLLITSIFLLIPVSLISAELATAWPGPGGIYRWISKAFGSRWGFLAIWTQWIETMVWYPTALAFAASTFAYSLGLQQLANNALFTASFVVIVFWSATLLSFFGIKFVSRFTSLGVVVGTILPGVLIILAGIYWIASGKPSLVGHYFHLIPELKSFSNISFLAGIILMFAGMEVGAVHVINLKKPKLEYPKAIFLSLIIIMVIFSLASFAIAAVIPRDQISLTAGLMEAVYKMLQVYHLSWLLPTIGLLVCYGVITGVVAWIFGPSKGLLATAKNGELPPILARTNKYESHTNILLIQAIVVTGLSSLFFVTRDISNAFFLLTAMAVILYLVVYFLLFLASIRLRYKFPTTPRPYKVPGGKVGIWLIASMGIIAVIFVFCIGFIPPAELGITSPKTYVFFIAMGLLTVIVSGLLIHAARKPEWVKEANL